jgi:hypothetical protein
MKFYLNSPITLLLVPLIGCLIIVFSTAKYTTRFLSTNNDTYIDYSYRLIKSFPALSLGLTTVNMSDHTTVEGLDNKQSVEGVVNNSYEFEDTRSMSTILRTGTGNMFDFAASSTLPSNLALIKVSAVETSSSEATSEFLMVVNKLKYMRHNLATMFHSAAFQLEQMSFQRIAIIISLINLVISVILWLQFDSGYLGTQFLNNVNELADTISSSGAVAGNNMGIDGLSLFFILLTTFITPIALLSTHNIIEKNIKFYLILILLLETLQIAVFSVLDLLQFYIYFESVLIPLFLIVGVWGASEGRIRAALLLFLYTLS